MNSETNLETSDEQLRPAERARLARFVLDCVYDEIDVPMPDFVFELVHRLDKVICSTKGERRDLRAATADKARQAAAFYNSQKNAGTPVTLVAAAAQFGISDRSLARYIKRQAAKALP